MAAASNCLHHAPHCCGGNAALVLLLGLFLFSLLEADLPAVAAASQLIAASLLANLHLSAHGLNTGA